MSLGLPSQVVYYQDKKENLMCSSKPRFVKDLLVSGKHTFKVLSSHGAQGTLHSCFYLMSDILS